jgi:hypothetical protein
VIDKSYSRFSLVNRRGRSFVPRQIKSLQFGDWHSKLYTRLLKLDYLYMSMPIRRHVRFLLTRNPNLKTVIIRNILGVSKRVWIEEHIPPGVEHLEYAAARSSVALF